MRRVTFLLLPALLLAGCEHSMDSKLPSGEAAYKLFPEADQNTEPASYVIGPLVMTDGVTDLGLVHGAGGALPHMPFFRPIGDFLFRTEREPGEAALLETLESADVCSRTQDDKTLVWARLAS